MHVELAVLLEKLNQLYNNSDFFYLKKNHTCPDEMTNLIINIRLLFVIVDNNVQIRLDFFLKSK